MRFLFFILLTSVFLNAHSLKIFSSEDAEFLSIKAYFSASSPCRDCNVSVDTYDKKVLNFKTNDKGIAKIPLDKNPIKVTVNAGLGHKNSIEITPNEKNQKKPYVLPFWLKILFGLSCIALFFWIISFIKKR